MVELWPKKHSGLVDWPALSLAAKIAHQQDKIFLGMAVSVP